MGGVGRCGTRVREQGAGSVPGAIPPAAVPGAVLPAVPGEPLPPQPLHAHIPPPPLLLLHWEGVLGGRRGKPALGLTGIKSSLLTIVQDYF